MPWPPIIIPVSMSPSSAPRRIAAPSIRMRSKREAPSASSRLTSSVKPFSMKRAGPKNAGMTSVWVSSAATMKRLLPSWYSHSSEARKREPM